MNDEETIHEAFQVGGLAGEIAVAEYILNQFPNEIPPRLKTFLQNILVKAYDEAGEKMGAIPEDLALSINKILEGVVKS